MTIGIELRNRVALLIDGDNGALPYLEPLVEFADYFGKVITRRIYGDWNATNLAPWRAQPEALKIEPVQVTRIGKNATDHRMLVEIGELLVDTSWTGEDVNVFIIVSGDGDFASACRYIREKGAVVIGVGGKSLSSSELTETCRPFYYLENLADWLVNRQKEHPIPPTEVRKVLDHVSIAYFERTRYYEWIPIVELEAKTREWICGHDHPEERVFDEYPFTEWLRHLDFYFETRGDSVRAIDHDVASTRRDILVKAYLSLRRPQGGVNPAQLGNVLRETDPLYEERFGGKKLTGWLKEYPDIFIVRDDGIWTTHEPLPDS